MNIFPIVHSFTYARTCVRSATWLGWLPSKAKPHKYCTSNSNNNLYFFFYIIILGKTVFSTDGLGGSAVPILFKRCHTNAVSIYCNRLKLS